MKVSATVPQFKRLFVKRFPHSGVQLSFLDDLSPRQIANTPFANCHSLLPQQLALGRRQAGTILATKS